MQAIWDSVLQTDAVLLRSPFFFLLIAQITQFTDCLLFSILDVKRGRVPLKLMVVPAVNGLLGFFPFFAMWYTEILIVEIPLPAEAPSFGRLLVELISCCMVGDFFHYWTHRLLHSNPLLRNHVHSVHHDYEGSLYSWIGMQVHPLEAVMINAAIYIPFVLFAHPMTIWTMAFGATMNAAFAHSGYNGGLASLYIPQTLTSNDHQLHHERNSTKNYGNIFCLWDKWFGTYGTNKKYLTRPLF